MKVECPKCSFTGNIKDELIPESGKNVVCPKCKTKFFVRKRIQHELEHNITNKTLKTKTFSEQIITPKKQNSFGNKTNFIIVFVLVCVVILTGVYIYSRINHFERIAEMEAADIENSETVEDVKIDTDGFDINKTSITTLRNYCISEWSIDPDSLSEMSKELAKEMDSIISWAEIITDAVEANSFPDTDYFDKEAHIKVIILARLLLEKNPEHAGIYYASIAAGYFGFLDFEKSQRYGLIACGFKNDYGCHIYKTSTLLIENWDGKIWNEDRMRREALDGVLLK